MSNSDNNSIYIKGARANNLKNISLHIPKNKFVVVTGVSGSGKSSLTMDTLFAEGQRRYVESLSSYARQFLMRMKKPEVDYIKGVCPAIAIEQKVTTGNNRSTVGTMSETYDFLRLLYARIGKTISPISGNEVKRHSITDVVDFVNTLPEGAKIQLFIPLPYKYANRKLDAELNLLLQKGYSRLIINDELVRIEDYLEQGHPESSKTMADLTDYPLRILIDRFIVENDNEENQKRIADSVLTAFSESDGECFIFSSELGVNQYFNNKFELDGIIFLEPTPQLFNFNNSLGACPACEGYGKTIGIDESKVIPDKSLSIANGAIACWRGERNETHLQPLLRSSHLFDLPVNVPYGELSKAQKKVLWSGNSYFTGIRAYFDDLESKLYKIQNRIILSRYRGKTVCSTCEGSRLRVEAKNVKINDKSIDLLSAMPIEDLEIYFKNLDLNEFDYSIAKRLLLEINNRLRFMNEVGLGYLTLDRISSTLSGGETQRLSLTRMLGSNLTSSMYILDEPSVGLHPRDTNRLVSVLKSLRDLGNTVVVVEHEEDIIKSADYLIDIGPYAGIHGGEVVFAGLYEQIYDKATDSLTTGYLNGRLQVPVPTVRRKFTKSIVVEGARQHNLKNIDVKIPLQVLTVISGVSGSGKTTLIKQILHPALLKLTLGEIGTSEKIGDFNQISGDISFIKQIEFVNQSPIGKSSRSNPVTYVKAYDSIRKIFSDQKLSKVRGYTPGYFSFNVEGGRCETCKGDGETIVEMQFLADVHLPCEDCKGLRFKPEVLEVKYKEKNIFEILDLSVEEALDFFKEEKDIATKLKPLLDVGLGYVKLGQASSTLSGGEAQRVKLAFYLGAEKNTEHILFIFDEPTTGLHFHDVKKLLDALNALVEKGHSVIVIEHNMDVIKSADWLIELGPEGGMKGGYLLYQGAPEGLLDVPNSPTAVFLKEKLH
ncbi:MAG: excinuclease ABC subunit UvrA [Saprospiraceae bacterium]|nr:excinuclease ABC subunit UvrA [Saprospiraceae bacterium]